MPIPEQDQPAVLSLATRIAKLHQASAILFWTDADWLKMYGVNCRRKDEAHVTIAVREMGLGTLDIGPQTRN